MTSETLPQADTLCRELVLKAIAASDTGIEFNQLCRQVRQHPGVTVRTMPTSVLRKVTVALEDDQVIDWEQPRHAKHRIYFLAGRAPRTGATCIPAMAAPRVTIAPRTWFSPLGAFA